MATIHGILPLCQAACSKGLPCPLDFEKQAFLRPAPWPAHHTLQQHALALVRAVARDAWNSLLYHLAPRAIPA